MKMKIFIESMSCSHCVNHVIEALKGIGANDVEVNLERKFATVEISKDITDDDIKLAIEDAGYDFVGLEKA